MTIHSIVHPSDTRKRSYIAREGNSYVGIGTTKSEALEACFKRLAPLDCGHVFRTYARSRARKCMHCGYIKSE